MFKKLFEKTQPEQLIQFIPRNEVVGDHVPKPKSAVQFLPQSYKELPRFGHNLEGRQLLQNLDPLAKEDKPRVIKNDFHMPTVKTCMPFLDAMRAGYIIPLDQDYMIDAEHKTFGVTPANRDGHDFGFHNRAQLPPEMTRGAEHAGKFHNRWIIKTPPGYSCLFIHPMNHPTNEFEIISGIVDTDTYVNEINFPFHWKIWNKQTILKAGTPMAQVIPFKREMWKSTTKFQNISKEVTKVNVALKTTWVDRYKRFFWQKKSWK